MKNEKNKKNEWQKVCIGSIHRRDWIPFFAFLKSDVEEHGDVAMLSDQGQTLFFIYQQYDFKIPLEKVEKIIRPLGLFIGKEKKDIHSIFRGKGIKNAIKNMRKAINSIWEYANEKAPFLRSKYKPKCFTDQFLDLPKELKEEIIKDWP